MAEYIEKKALMVALCKEITGDGDYYNGKDDMQDQIRDMVSRFPAADVAPVRHGRWVGHEETPEDAYCHHKCSECNVNAPFDYKMRDDWDEGMDGEWYSLGLVDDGINEHLTDYCPHCGAKMDGGEG